jgi:23S rRNA-/tRNA-specific pseudouridylate synthase
VERQLLHAARIGLVHPVTEKDIEFTAPVPEDFVRFEAFLHAP